MKLWLNGKLVDEQDARISPFDRGLLLGDGVFETLRVYRGTPFAWRRLMERLQHSAEGMELQVPDINQLRKAADEVLKANELVEGRLRITITGGLGPPGLLHGPESTAMVTATAFTPWPETIETVISPWPSNERRATVGIKTIAYAEGVRALQYAKAHGATEAIVCNTRGEVCEAAAANVFIVQDDVVKTPPLTSGCLNGVTRGLLLELCEANGIPHKESVISPAELLKAEEVSLTASTRQVNSVARVDETHFKAPGPISSRLQQLFHELVSKTLDP